MNQTEIEQELDYIANTIPSAWEFVHYTFLIEGVSRDCTKQVTRTRTGSYAEQSMRVTDQCDFNFIVPNDIGWFGNSTDCLDETIEVIQSAYQRLIDQGVKQEDARCILPGGISTNILCAYNLRTFSDLIKSRSGGRTQDEYQKIIHAMANAVIEVHPWAIKFMYNKSVNYFDEIEAFAKRKFPDLKERGELLKIVDKMRKEK